MKDDYTKVEISKTDITGEEEIEGAHLQILDKDGEVVEEWTSTKEPHLIEYLPVGEYTLHEGKCAYGIRLCACGRCDLYGRGDWGNPAGFYEG